MQEQSGSGTWIVVLRAALLLAVVAGISALGLQLAGAGYSDNQYFWRNQLSLGSRLDLVKGVVVSATIAGSAVFGIAGALGSQLRANASLLWRLARILAPIAPLSFVPVMLHWQLWTDHELIYLTLVVIVSFVFKATVTLAAEANLVDLLWSSLPDGSKQWLRLRDAWARIPAGFWLAVAIVAAVAYSVWFSYYTVIWHRSARSGWDLSIEDNILWNILHGGHFYKAAPALGPTGSHFARHSTVIAYALAPVYAFYQSAEMVLILQTVLIGAAAIPLYLLGRARVGAPLAALLSILYLMHPGVQEGNLFEMHYVKLGTLPFWTTLWLLDTRRYRGALIAAATTLMVREDVATWIVLLGAFALIAGVRWPVSLAMFLGGLCYVAIVKFVIMPWFVGGHDELLFMYEGLLPKGKSSFAWAMIVAVTNPAYVLKTLLTPEKLIYLLHVLTPILFVPLRRPLGWFALIPGVIFCFLSTGYTPLYDIHYQYSPHLLAMMYPVLIVILGADLKRGAAEPPPGANPCLGDSNAGNIKSRTVGTVTGIVLSTFLCSAQFGSVIQQNTSRGGPMPYRFGWDDEGRARRSAIEELREILPKDANVAASAFTITQVSARANAYSLSIDVYDAEYIIAPTNRAELLPSEAAQLATVFAKQTFGVVAVRKPFFLMRRGHSTEGNAQVWQWIR